VNLTGTLNLLQCMADGAVRTAVFASSMAVYADSERPAPLAEGAPLAPISPYGIAKLAAERYWLMMCAHFGIPGTVLRYFNTYGPGQTPTPYVGVITIFIHRLLRGEAPVIYGDGEQRRDFVHVDDVVSANLAGSTAGPA
jgi:UDP-glucose 4-epimerase